MRYLLSNRKPIESYRQTANTARVGVSPAVRSQNHKVVKALKSPVNEVFTSLRCDATVTVTVIIFLLFNDQRLRLRERLQNWPIQASSCNSPDHCCKLDTFQFPEMRFSGLPVLGSGVDPIGSIDWLRVGVEFLSVRHRDTAGLKKHC